MAKRKYHGVIGLLFAWTLNMDNFNFLPNYSSNVDRKVINRYENKRECFLQMTRLEQALVNDLANQKVGISVTITKDLSEEEDLRTLTLYKQRDIHETTSRQTLELSGTIDLYCRELGKGE